MRQTVNYGLNQWDEEDRILREDFNGDNAKVDTAIQAVDAKVAASGAAELIRSGISGGKVSRIDLNLSGVDWSRYALVVFTLSAPSVLHGSFSSGAGGSWQSAGYPNWESGKLMDISNTSFASIFMPVGRSGESHVRTFGLSNNTYFGIANAAVKNVGSFYVQTPASSIYFPAGTSFSMWGVR